MTSHEKWTHIPPLNKLQMVKRVEVGLDYRPTLPWVALVSKRRNKSHIRNIT